MCARSVCRLTATPTFAVVPFALAQDRTAMASMNAGSSNDAVAAMARKQMWSDMSSDTVSAVPTEPTQSGSDSDGMTTMRSDSTRLSNSRSHASRGSGRKKRDKAKYLAACKAKYEAEGKTFIIHDEDAFKKKQSSNMLQSSTITEDGCTIDEASAKQSTEAAIAKILEAANTNKFTIEERMAAKRKLDSYFAPKFAVKPKKKESIELTLKTYVVPRDKWEWCHLCEKWMTDTHRDSKDHIERVEEMSAITEMIGTCSSARRFSKTPGLQGLLTKSAIRTFWGSDVEGMSQIV